MEWRKRGKRIKLAAECSLNILQSDRALGPTIRTKLMIAYKCGRTLRDHLVQADPRQKYAKVLPKISQKTGCYKCYNCNVCNSLICGSHFSHPHKGNQYQIREYFNCNTDFSVYILRCPCALTYVGKTVGPFKKQFQKHRSDIRVALAKTEKGKQADPNKPAAVHFVTSKHQIHELRGMVIEQVKPPNRGETGHYSATRHIGYAHWARYSLVVSTPTFLLHALLTTDNNLFIIFIFLPLHICP